MVGTLRFAHPTDSPRLARHYPWNENARAGFRRAQFRLWIFSYTILPRASKKRLSRLMIGRVGKARSACPGGTRRWARFALPTLLRRNIGGLGELDRDIDLAGDARVEILRPHDHRLNAELREL